MKNIPEKIYLQIDDDEVPEDFNQLEVTWCTDRINENDIAYIREPSTEQSGGTEQEEFAMKFLEYASGLAVSNYKSGGNWYLSDGRIVKTADILKQFKEESKP